MSTPTIEVPAARAARLSGYVQPGKRLPWRWVSARMASARHYWITTRTSGFPSSRPVWGIWFDPVLLFSSGSRIAANLKVDPRLQVNLERGDEVVLIEGYARALTDLALAREWAARYRTKYEWEIPDSPDGVFCVHPHRVLAWLSDASGLDGGVAFSSSPTEWRFTSDRSEA